MKTTSIIQWVSILFGFGLVGTLSAQDATLETVKFKYKNQAFVIGNVACTEQYRPVLNNNYDVGYFPVVGTYSDGSKRDLDSCNVRYSQLSSCEYRISDQCVCHNGTYGKIFCEHKSTNSIFGYYLTSKGVRLTTDTMTLYVFDSLRLYIPEIAHQGHPFISKVYSPDTLVLNEIFNWKSTDTTVAKISADGIILPLKEGYTTIEMSSFNNLLGKQRLRVLSPPDSISIEPNNSIVMEGDTIQYHTYASYKGLKNKLPLLNDVVWGVSNTTAAEIDTHTGRLIATHGGHVEVSAIHNGFAAQTQHLQIHPLFYKIDSIIIEPSDTVITEGTTLQFQAYAVFDNGHKVKVKKDLMWGVNHPKIATLDPALGKLVTLKEGEVEVNAIMKGIAARPRKIKIISKE